MRLIGACILLLPFFSLTAQAGAQKYEPLSASVQASLHKAVSDKRPPASSFGNPMEAVDWIEAMSARLAKRIPNQEYPTGAVTRGSLRSQACRPGPAVGAWADASGKRISKICGFERWRPWVYAGNAILAESNRETGRQPVQYAHQFALWLHHPSSLPRYRAGGSVPRTGALQRKPRTAGVPQRSTCGLAQPVELHAKS